MKKGPVITGPFLCVPGMETLGNYRMLINKAYGYRNKERFKTGILFHCGGLNLYPKISQ